MKQQDENRSKVLVEGKTVFGGQNEQQMISDRSREGTHMKLIKILLEYVMVLAGMALVSVLKDILQH